MDMNQALLNACVGGSRDLAAVRQQMTSLLDKGAQAVAVTPLHQDSPVQVALCRRLCVGATEILTRMIAEAGGDVNHANVRGESVLQTALRHQADISFLRFLVTQNASVNHVDKDGWSVAHWAVYSFPQSLDVMKLLTDHQDLNLSPHEEYAWNLLHLAVSCKCSDDMLRLLLSHPTGQGLLDGVDKFGRNAAHWAVLSGCSLGVLTLLQEKKPELFQALDRSGWSVVHYAAAYGVPVDVLTFLVTPENVPFDIILRRTTAARYHLQACHQVNSSIADIFQNDAQAKAGLAAEEVQQRMKVLSDAFSAAVRACSGGVTVGPPKRPQPLPPKAAPATAALNQ